ncbi:tetratricopeptide repeat protein [Litorivicinus sp.]|nr:tetratricopeptide repeat protein [Litorivicinus sp.]
MDYLRSDDEQAELLKQWLKKNGLGLIIAASIGVGSVFGYQEWQDFQINQQTDAASRYQELIELSAVNFADPGTDEDYARLLTLAEGLRQTHADSNYAALGAGILAAQAVERGDYDLAVSQLNYAESTVGSPELRAMTALRLARLELELGQANVALSRIQSMVPSSLLASTSELEGDILVVLERLGEAREAYERAHVELISKGFNSAVVDIKRSSLPEGS